MKWFYICLFMLFSPSSFSAVLLDSQTGSPLCLIGERINWDFLPASLVEQNGEGVELQECSDKQILTAASEKILPLKQGLPLAAIVPFFSHKQEIPKRVTLASASLILGCTIAGVFMLDAREIMHEDVEVGFKAPGWLGFVGITAATFGTLIIADAKTTAHFAAGSGLKRLCGHTGLPEQHRRKRKAQ